MKPISSDLDCRIRRLLRDCGQQAEQMAAQQFEISQKGPGDYVTSIDSALDQRLSAAFSTLFPGDGLITEENAPSRKKFAANYDRLWCIDPLDGTSDFIKRTWSYAVMVGLLQNYQPIAGWIYAPAYDTLYYGGSGWGLFQAIADRAPAPLLSAAPAAPTAGFCPLLIGYWDQNRFGGAITRLIPSAQFYSVGSFGLKVLEVIQGRAGLYLYLNGRVKIWDTVGPIALAQAAGLVCCDLEGEAINFSANSIDFETLTHQQPILIGWPQYIEQLRPKLRQAVENTLSVRC